MALAFACIVLLLSTAASSDAEEGDPGQVPAPVAVEQPRSWGIDRRLLVLAVAAIAVVVAARRRAKPNPRDVANETVGALSADVISLNQKVNMLEAIRRPAVYPHAVEAGLYSVLVHMLRADALEVCARWRGAQYCSFVHWMTNTLFNRDGRSAHGDRWAAFIRSADDAWPAWLAAAGALVSTVTDRRIIRNPTAADLAVRASRDVLSSLGLGLAQQQAACAFFYVDDAARGANAPTTAGPAASARLKATLTALRPMLANAREAAERKVDRSSLLEANINQVAGLLEVWSSRFGVPTVDVSGELKLSTKQKAMYAQVAVPMATRAIAAARGSRS